MPRNQHEFKLTVAIADQLRARATPGVYFTHLPMGEARSEATGARLKRMGTRAGAPDFLLIHLGKPFGLELKTDKGRQSPAQIATQQDWEAAGGKYFVAHGYDMAVGFLETWGLLKPDRSIIRPDTEAAA